MKTLNQQDIHNWVEQIYSSSNTLITKTERKEQSKYATMMIHPSDKIFLSKMLDDSSQIRNSKKLSRRIKVLIDTYGVPKFFGFFDQLLLKAYQKGGYLFTYPAIPLIKHRIRRDTETVIIDEARPHLTKHLASRYQLGIGQNINLLGEVVLGNNEADIRYHHYLNALKQPDINYISVKISGIYAQLHPLNFEQSKAELVKRLSALYQVAIDNPYVDKDGNKSSKFVNLDMEEYKDTHITLDIFKTTLSLPQFENYRAGIVIQAYLSDAKTFFNDLLNFATKRFIQGGSPIKMRLVKGANLQMESVISSLKGWENPILTSKIEVDANYMHILDVALKKENAPALNVGVASHNLYTIAYANLVTSQNRTEEYVTFEMLEGMANHVWRAMSQLGKKVILYTPVVSDKHFLNAVSYLVRRLDENTGVDNFLSYSFNLKPNTKDWAFLKEQFNVAYSLKDGIPSITTRTQDKSKPYHETIMDSFVNESDTDFDLLSNQQWAKDIVSKWQNISDTTVFSVQVGSTQEESGKYQEYKSRDEKESIIYKIAMSDEAQIDRILSVADEDHSGWRQTTIKHRNTILQQVANNLASSRGALIGCMSAITGKTILEGDVEVSEAIDFCRFYPLSYNKFDELTTIELSPKGTVLVISPWNFPLAIPVGGVAASLSGGNTVILKPATVSAPISYEFAKCFWDAGVPKEALQILIPSSREGLTKLTASSIIKHTILTGGTDTAIKIQSTAPTTPLSAETGGKNAIILTESGDRDKAIMNVVASAFGNAGQKCSACSLFLVEKGVYNDSSFKEKLKDATLSLQTGSAWELNNVIGGMVTSKANNDKLMYALDNLELGEEWLVAPNWLDDYTLKPTVKWGVKPGSFSFKTELFAPMLSVVEVDSLSHAIELVNSLDYGLTSGIQSLDEAEIRLWRDSIEAGNLYINRGITGAIVNRQPFGGMKLSAFGGGVKAGGVNYVSCFVKANNKQLEDSYEDDYKEVYSVEFEHSRDVCNLYGEQNTFRYLPLKRMVLRVLPNDNLEDIKLIVHASNIVHTPMDISIDIEHPFLNDIKLLCNSLRIESLSEFIISLDKWDRIRTASEDIPLELSRSAGLKCKYISSSKPVKEGRLELLHYLKEQSITYEYHRYGSITDIPIF